MAESERKTGETPPVRSLPSRAVLAAVPALLVVGIGVWLLLPGETGSTATATVDTIPAPRPPGTGAPAPHPPAGGLPAPGMPAVAAGDAAGDLPEWFGRLAAAAGSGSPVEAEAARYAIRHVISARDVDVPDLLRRVADERARSEVIPLWIDVHGPPPSADLQRWLSDQPPPVRTAACFRLARLGAPGRDVLAAALSAEDDERVGSEALVWLLRRGGAEGFDAAAAVRSEEAVIRSATAGLLARPDDRKLAEVLRSALDRPLPFRIREAVVDALAASYPQRLRQPPASADDLFRRAGDADIVTKTLALREAGNFMDQWKKSAPVSEEIERVRTLVRDAVTLAPDPLVRRAAILSRVGLSADIRDLAGQCRALLAIGERDPDPGVRAAVLRRVHRGSAHTRMPFGPDYLVPYVKDDPDPEVRLEALRTLPRYSGQGEQEAEARRLLAWALERDPDRDVRLEAAALLTEFGFDAAREDLYRAATGDPDPAFRDALYDAVRDQIAPLDPELFEKLCAADPKRALDRLRSVDPSGSDDPALRDRDAIRLVPRSRQVAPPEPLPAPEDADPAPESEESSPPAADGWRRVEFPIRSATGGPALQAVLDFPAGKEAPLFLVVPPDPLLGGAPWPLPLPAIRSAARRAGHAVLTFDWRGRGGSEGFAGGLAGSREDFRAALAAARDPRSVPGWPAECRTTGAVRVLLTGRGAEAAEGVLPESLLRLEAGGIHGEPGTAQAAFARGLEREGRCLLTDLEAFLR